MGIIGQINIAGHWQPGDGEVFHAHDPRHAESLAPPFRSASKAQMDRALAAAEEAAPLLRASSVAERAQFLNACADEIMALGDALLDRVSLETGYPKIRSEAERARTCAQLRMFADYILTGRYLDIRIDHAQPERKPQPRPDLRYSNQALGPVVVFGASNFPLAYSVAGGDTASALAAGCPVIVKGHPSHPGTCELVARALDRAVKRCAMPAGTFSLINGIDNDVGAYLVQAAQVKAVGFTGSFAGGTALFKLANQRPEPIPVFAEMGSINPIFLLDEALATDAETIANNFVGSLTLGTGQFCVNPGLVVAVQGPGLERFLARAAAAIGEVPEGVMLNSAICSGYHKGANALADSEGVTVVAKGQVGHSETGYFGQTQLLITSAETFLANPSMQDEVFGPSSLVIRCSSIAELINIAQGIKGQLTVSLHASETELANYAELAAVLATKAGRVVINGFPTGVEVVPSMVHGGPFPATTDSRFTSVGTAAIKRFVRPVCWQNYPQALLPEALQDSNPLQLPRLVDGTMVNP